MSCADVSNSGNICPPQNLIYERDDRMNENKQRTRSSLRLPACRTNNSPLHYMACDAQPPPSSSPLTLPMSPIKNSSTVYRPSWLAWPAPPINPRHPQRKNSKMRALSHPSPSAHTTFQSTLHCRQAPATSSCPMPKKVAENLVKRLQLSRARGAARDPKARGGSRKILP